MVHSTHLLSSASLRSFFVYVLDNSHHLWTRHSMASGSSATAAVGAHGAGGAIEEENRMLQRELNRVEDMLSQTRAEKDELGIKLNALSEKVSAATLSSAFNVCCRLTATNPILFLLLRALLAL